MADVPGLHVSMDTRNQVAFASNEPAEVFLSRGEGPHEEAHEPAARAPPTEHSWKEAQEQVSCRPPLGRSSALSSYFAALVSYVN